MQKLKTILVALIAIGALQGNVFAASSDVSPYGAKEDCIRSGGTWVDALGICIKI